MKSAMMGDINWISLIPMVPELFLCVSTILLLLYGVYRVEKVTSFYLWMGILSLGCAIMLVQLAPPVRQVVMNGMFVSSALTVFAKTFILIAGALVLLMSSDWLKSTKKPFEFMILIMFALLGMMLMVSANDMLALYMSLEMSSLALYVLASFDRDNARSTEAGLKYFVLGALASGMLLFGISLIYGFAGSTSFDALATLLSQHNDPAVYQQISKGITVGLVLVIVGFCFKLSAVPFHMWTPDVYEGSPTLVTTFFATAPKVAAVVLFMRVLMQPFADAVQSWQQVLLFASSASMLLGAFAAIMQSNIKRMLAYSSIGHVGFMLMGIASGNQSGIQATLIYLALYVFMSSGAFGCVLLMRRDGRYVEEIRDLAGLSQSRPVLALVISAFMFSMAGIPPLAGFFGKMYVIMATIEAGILWLAVIAVISSVIGCFYYLKIVKTMYFDEPMHPLQSAAPLGIRIVVGLCAGVTLLFFLLPSPLVASAKTAAQAMLS